MDLVKLEKALAAQHVGSEVRARVLAMLESANEAAWPVDEHQLAAHLSNKLARGSSALAWDDLTQAFAAASRVEVAWQAFERRCRPAVRAALMKMLPAGQAEDLEQTLFAELAVAETSALLGYAGEGPLAGWLVVVATRRAWKLAARELPRANDDDTLLDRIAAGQKDPALELFKAQHSETFRSCIKSAFARLSTKERNLLRLHHLDGVQTAELAKVHGVHRATVVRWLADARQSFVSNFRDEFAAKLGAQRLEVDSLARVFRSGLDISLPMESVDAGLMQDD
jgi:RNA polymerase sigma-70 factor, ECF subfamily